MQIQLKNKFDVIILSLAINEETFNTTKQCVDSYIETADDLINNIFIVETNPKFNNDYKQKKVTVIKPNEQFNYNKFYNIALDKCVSEFVIGPNNDVFIQPNCLQTILKEFNNNSNIHSISPINRNWHRHTKMYFPSENKLYYGYEVSLHLYGCIFACRRSIFKQIGFLDESFYYFYQDNDYSMCLRRIGLLHGAHTGAQVVHNSGHSDKYADTKFKYTSQNMHEQGELFHEKWTRTSPYNAEGYRPFKPYTN
jgi:hypothetical protein